MKTKPKTKIIPRKKASKKAGSVKKQVSLSRIKLPGAKHLKLVEHIHTGKLISRKHTSHLSLMLILILLGFFLCVNIALVRANGGSVSIGMIVNGPAPTVGAVIMKPTDGFILTDQNITEVSGTCAANTFVVVKDNGLLAGSTNCTEAGIFVLQIQLQTGNNVLSALNYDNINQSGPITNSVIVIVIQTIADKPEVVVPVLPSNPSIISEVVSNANVGVDTSIGKVADKVKDNVTDKVVDQDISSCDNYQAGNVTIGGEPHISIVCIPRLFLPKIQQTMGILVWGGTPPYAINITWGDNTEDTLISMPEAGYRTEKFVYASAGSYKISLKLKDKNNKQALVQTAVQVSGVVTPASGTVDIPFIINNISTMSAVEASVPFYLLAVAITLGFWCGDIFERVLGSPNLKK